MGNEPLALGIIISLQKLIFSEGLFVKVYGWQPSFGGSTTKANTTASFLLTHVYLSHTLSG